MQRAFTAAAGGALGLVLFFACAEPYGGADYKGDAAPDVDAASDSPLDGAGDGDATSDGGPCDLTKPFGGETLLSLGPFGSTNDSSPRLSPDELAIVFASSFDGGFEDIYQSQRATAGASFGTPTVLLNIGGRNRDPMLAADGLALYFSTDRNDAGTDIWRATRSSPSGAFELPSRVEELATASADIQPFLTAAGDELFFSSERGGNPDLYRATVSGGTIAPPLRVFELASGAAEWDPVLSADGLTIYFASNRVVSDAAGGFDIYVAQRPTTKLPFGPATNVHELNTPSEDRPAWLSPDNCRLYVTASYSGSFRMYRADRTR